jgi:predicted MFS family arabinose efflux permease
MGPAFGGLIALTVAIGIGRFVYTPLLPLMVNDLRMTTGAAGLLASANFAGYLAGALLAATPVVSGPRRRWLLGGLIVSALTTGAMALVSSPAAFLLLRFAGGVASAFGLVFASALVLDRLAEGGRAELSAVHFAGVGVGVVVSALLSSGLAAVGGGWRSVWLASGAIALLGVAFVARLIPDRVVGPPAAAASATRPDRRILAFATAYGLFGFGYIITATFLVAIVREGVHGRAFEPVVWLVFGLSAVPSVAVWTLIARRIGIARAFTAACVAEAVGVGASVVQTPVAILLAAALVGGTFMGLTALGLIGARSLAHGDPRSLFAVMTAAFGLGQIVGPAFAGVVHDATGSFVLPTLIAVAALVVSGLLTASVETPPAGTS